MSQLLLTMTLLGAYGSQQGCYCDEWRRASAVGGTAYRVRRCATGTGATKKGIMRQRQSRFGTLDRLIGQDQDSIEGYSARAGYKARSAGPDRVNAAVLAGAVGLRQSALVRRAAG